MRQGETPPFRPRSPAWRHPAALTAGLLLALLLTFSALPADRVLSMRDAGHLYLAIKDRTSEALRAGKLPLWEERVGCGQPFLADPISQFFYPANLLFLWMSPVQGLKGLILLHLLLAAAAMMLLAEEFGLDFGGSLLAGLLWMACGAVVSHHYSPPWITGLPWFLVAWAVSRRLLRGLGGWGSTALLASVLALLVLAGSFELMAAYGILVAAQALAQLGLGSGQGEPPPGWRSRLKRGGWIALAGGVAAGLASAQLLPSFEFFWFSSRVVGVPEFLASPWSLPPGRLLELVAPHLFGNLAQGEPWTVLLRPSPFSHHPLLAGIYVGIPALALALAGWDRWPRRERFFLLGMLAVTVFLSLGDSTPLFQAARSFIPGVGLFRYPAKIFTLSMIPLMLLAGAGLTEVIRRPAKRRLALIVAGAMLLLLSLGLLLGWVFKEALLCWIAEGLAREGVPLSARQIWQDSLLALLRGQTPALLFLVLLFFMGRIPPPLRRASLLLLLLLDLGLANRTLVASRDRDRHLAPPATLPAPATLRGAAGTMRVGQSRPGTAEIVYEPHLLVFHGYRIAHTYGSLGLANEEVLEVTLRDLPQRLLHLKSVRLAMERRQGQPPFAVRWIAESLPRASLIPAAAFALDDAAAERYLRSPRFDPAREVLISDTLPDPLPEAPPSRAANRVQMVTDEAEEVRLRVESTEPAYLLLTDSWFPGWGATVNGKPQPVYRANLMFRALQVPAGRSEVLFRYRPPLVRAGLQISGLSLLLMLWLLSEWYRARRGPLDRAGLS